MKKFLHIAFKALKIIFGVLLIVYIAVFSYVSINKKSIIKQVTDEVGKKLNGKVSVEDVGSRMLEVCEESQERLLRVRVLMGLLFATLPGAVWVR